jgi:hypothetical protein
MSTKYSSTKDGQLLWCVLVPLLLGFIPAGAWAQTYDACGPAPAVKAALDQLPQQKPADTFWQYHEQRLAALQALLRQYPDDVFIQQAYIRSVNSASEMEKVIAEYKSRHERNSTSAQLTYLYGLTLVGRQSPEAIKLFNAALEQDRAFALPHLELVTIYRSQVFANKPQSVQHLQAYLDACPASFEGYGALTGVADKEFLRPYAVKLRALVENRSDADAVGAYRTLWALEFKTHPASEYDALRRQVGQDLARLRQLQLEDKPQWYLTLERGYELVGDKKQVGWADDQYLTRIPQPCATVASGKFWDDHMFPGADSPPDKKHAFYSALYEQSGQWLKERPNCLMFWTYRIYGIENLDDLPPAEVGTNIDQMLEATARNAGPEGLGSFHYSEAAEVFAKSHLKPERVVEWAQKGLAKWQNEAEKRSQAPPYDLDTEEHQQTYATNQAESRLRLLGYEIDGYLQLEQADKAQAQLEQMDRWLQEFKLLGGKENPARTDARLYAVYWGLRARAADLQGRKQDAMAFYENALLARLTAQQKPETGRKDELADNAHQLWKSLGGTEEGWQLWYGRPANDLVSQATLWWEDTHEPLPAFELADLDGKTWNLAALRGKTIFLTFWATW